MRNTGHVAIDELYSRANFASYHIGRSRPAQAVEPVDTAVPWVADSDKPRRFGATDEVIEPYSHDVPEPGDPFVDIVPVLLDGELRLLL